MVLYGFKPKVIWLTITNYILVIWLYGFMVIIYIYTKIHIICVRIYIYMPYSACTYVCSHMCVYIYICVCVVSIEILYH